jgi:hypothetical protein
VSEETDWRESFLKLLVYENADKHILYVLNLLVLGVERGRITKFVTERLLRC